MTSCQFLSETLPEISGCHATTVMMHVCVLTLLIFDASAHFCQASQLVVAIAPRSSCCHLCQQCHQFFWLARICRFAKWHRPAMSSAATWSSHCGAYSVSAMHHLVTWKKLTIAATSAVHQWKSFLAPVLQACKHTVAHIASPN